MLTSQIEEDETINALKEMKNQKAPEKKTALVSFSG